MCFIVLFKSKFNYTNIIYSFLQDVIITIKTLKSGLNLSSSFFQIYSYEICVSLLHETKNNEMRRKSQPISLLTNILMERNFKLVEMISQFELFFESSEMKFKNIQINLFK